MAKTKPTSRRNVIPTSNYGLVNEMAMIPPPVGDDETSTATSDQETQNAPADTITETAPTEASETPPTADSAAITETPTPSSEPPAALSNQTTENPITPFDLPTEAQMTTIAPSETGNEASNGQRLI